MEEQELWADVVAGFHWDVVHVFDAAGDLYIFAVGGDALGGLVDGLQAGAAQAVGGAGTDGDWQACDEGCHSGDVEALFSLLLDATPVDVFDGVGGDLAAFQESGHDPGRQVIGTDIAKHAFLGWARPMGVRMASMTTACRMVITPAVRKVDCLPPTNSTRYEKEVCKFSS